MDKLLGAIKDFSNIKRYLAAINQTTDDYLVALDISTGIIQFFGPIQESFKIDTSEDNSVSLEAFMSVVHPADRKALFDDISEVSRGEKQAHDMDFRMFNRNGETVWVNSCGKVLHDEKGKPHVMIGRLSEEALRHLFNPTTGLWNKTKLRQDMETRLHSAKGWLMMLGIPAFVDINLSRGRDFGNQLLSDIANALEEIDLIEESYHTEQNNFAIVIGECGEEKAEQIYRRICDVMNEKCSVCAGVVPIDSSVFMDVSQILDSANITLNSALQNLMGQILFFSSDDIVKRIKELKLLEELKESVQNGFEGFEVLYQPQIKCGTYELHGVEALLRYNSKKRGRVFPDEFIPILEQSGLIEPVGMWVLDQALSQCKIWRRKLENLKVSVNFSTVQFDNRRLGENVIDALKRAELPGDALTVELTESIQLSSNKNYSCLIKYIKSYGVSFSIDDFGTGYSNLGYLKQLDVNEIKIDRNFVSEIEKNTYNYHLISNVIEFAKTNSIHTCCEGVETAKELSVLEPLQADLFQGYLFDKPCTAEEITKKYIDSTSDEYKNRMGIIDEINLFKERFGSIHFDPKNILRENNIGLWILRADEKNNRYEMYMDSVMEHALGIEEKLSPEECYKYFRDRILPEHRDVLSRGLEMMVKSDKPVQLEYRWQHPTYGEVLVRSSGIKTGEANGIVTAEGYHRILTGVEKVLVSDNNIGHKRKEK